MRGFKPTALAVAEHARLTKKWHNKSIMKICPRASSATLEFRRYIGCHMGSGCHYPINPSGIYSQTLSTVSRATHLPAR